MKGKIGKTQLNILESIDYHKGWYPSCGWIWDNSSSTEKILNSLVRRGLVDLNEDVRRRRRYTLNAAGKEVLDELSKVRSN